MKRISTTIAPILFLAAIVAWPSGANAETEQYCSDYQGALQAQIKRADAAKCNVEGWFWSRDAREQSDFCRRSDAAELQYWQNQRESQLTFCEVQAATQARQAKSRMPRLTAKDFRIAGGPGDYTLHWALDFQGCSGPQIDIDFRCFVQIRLETPPGRPGAYAHELEGRGRKEGFNTVRADKYPGQPGDVVRLKWHACAKENLLASSCEPWSELALVMPRPAPDFRAARVIGVDHSEYTPDRFDRERRVAQVNRSSGFHTFRVRLEGSREPFTPAAFQGGEAWKPQVRVRVTSGPRVLAQTPVVDVPSNGEVPVPVPLKELNSLNCRPQVDVTGLCATLDVEVESFRYWTTGNVSVRQEPMGKSQSPALLRVVNPHAAQSGQQQATLLLPSTKTDPLGVPPTITSPCNTTYNLGVINFAARHTNVERHTDSRPISAQLQYAGGQGLWGTSPLLEGLAVMHDTNPPEYRATLSAAQLTALASTWRWRIRARVGERWSDWCQFTVAAPHTTGAARTPQSVSPNAPTAPVRQPAIGSKPADSRMLNAPVGAK